MILQGTHGQAITSWCPTNQQLSFSTHKMKLVSVFIKTETKGGNLKHFKLQLPAIWFTFQTVNLKIFGTSDSTCIASTWILFKYPQLSIDHTQCTHLWCDWWTALLGHFLHQLEANDAWTLVIRPEGFMTWH